MKTYEGKTLDDVIQHACQDLGITPDELTYEIIEEKRVCFLKKLLLNVIVKVWFKNTWKVL